MSKLCIDIGNTSITYCYVADNKPSVINRFSTSNNLLDWFNKLTLNNISTAVISSVVPELSKQINELFKTRDIDVFEVSYMNSSLNLNVDTPSDVGNDRICNIAAAMDIYGAPSIVIDFGTATTYDIIDETGSFIGGAIAPGIDVSANNLISKAALLKDVAYKFPNSIIGKDTISNIQSGVMLGGLYSVEGMIRHIKEEMQSPGCNIILTGGFGSLISSALTVEHIYNEHLTIYGMLSIFKKNS